jgi:hypothetical protein
MPTWLDGIMSPLNAAGETLQKFIEVRDLAKFGDTFRKMHGEVLAAMQSAVAANTREAALLHQIRELEEKVRSFETWNTEKNHYEMKALRAGVYAYMLKRSERSIQPPHWVCINCYNNGKISPFQWTAHSAQGHRVFQYSDPRCKAEIAAGSEPRWID